MNLRLIRIISFAFWLSFGIVILLRHQVAPQWAAQQDDSKLTMIGIFAMVMAIFQLYRWNRISRSRSYAIERPHPLQPKSRNERPEEYLPEFDFSAQTDPDEKTP